jgi:predicted P-loop ATPase
MSVSSSEIGPHVPEIDPNLSPLEQAVLLVAAGLQLVLVHAPSAKGCTCGKKSCEAAGKHPIEIAWQKRPLTEEQQVRDAFAARKFTPNVGVILGLQPSGHYLIAIDVDDAERFKTLEAEHGRLPETAASESARGKKFLFLIPAGVSTDRIKNITGLGKVKGVDVKAKGGQVVAPPSKHASGTVYRWASVGPIAQLPPAWILAISAQVPEPPPPWTFRKDRALGSRDRKRAQAYLETKLQDRSAIVAGCGVGLRNTTLLHELCSCLATARGIEREYPHGKYYVLDTLVRAAQNAGLPQKEIDSVVKNAQKWVDKENATHVPDYLRVIEGGGSPSPAPESIPPPSETPAAPAPSKPLSGADPFPRVDDLKHLPEPWMKELLWMKRSKGRGDEKEEWFEPKSCPENAVVILNHDTRWTGIIARDDFKEIEISLKMPPWHDATGASVGEWTDQDTTRLGGWLDRAYGVELKSTDLDRIVAVVAERRRFHPVREYLESLTWDRVSRLEEVLPAFFGAVDTPFTRAVGARWMKSAVARVLDPGTQVDCILVLEGAQGLGKNRGMRALVPDRLWLSETRIEIGSKDGLQSLRGKWIVFLDELDSIRGKEVSKVKNFITDPMDYYRESYGRRNRNHLRQCVFAGSTNEGQWLTDMTGNRRFWPVKIVRSIDVELIRANRDQLWAEAYSRVRAGETWHVDTPELRALCEGEQEVRVHEDIWIDKVSPWLRAPMTFAGVPLDVRGGILALDVAVHCLGIEPGRISRGDSMRIGSILKKLGYVHVQRKTPDGRHWFWMPTEQSAQPA